MQRTPRRKPDTDQIVALYSQGFGFSKIQKLTTYSKSTIKRAIDRAGLAKSKEAQIDARNTAKRAQAQESAQRKALNRQRLAFTRLLAKRAKALSPKASWYQRNRERAKATAKEFYEVNKERILESRRQAFASNPNSKQLTAIKNARYRKRHPELVKMRRREFFRTEAGRACRKRQYSKPEVRIRSNLRNRVRELLGSIEGKSSLIGCTSAHLKAWLESKFSAGMTWSNYGTVWHVDHVIPLASFDLTREDQRRIACNWQNLQPLYAADNYAKSDTLTDKQTHLPIEIEGQD